MKRKTPLVVAGVLIALACAGCGDTSRLPESAGVGPNPTLPEPTKTAIPTVHIAPAEGWPEDVKPVSAVGTQVAPFATGLDHPRWVYVLPNGDVLVAESAGPPREPKGIKAWIMGKLMRK